MLVCGLLLFTSASRSGVGDVDLTLVAWVAVDGFGGVELSCAVV
jgi:hypothetical protein